VQEYYETSSDSASASFGSDSFSQSGSFSDSNDGQHDSDSGSEYEGLYKEESHYGYYTTIIDSASEASSLSDYSLDERDDDTTSNPETDGSASTEHGHYVDGVYTYHAHHKYERDHHDLVDGLNSDNDSDIDPHYHLPELTPKTHEKSTGIKLHQDQEIEGPYKLGDQGYYYLDHSFYADAGDRHQHAKNLQHLTHTPHQ